MDLRRLEVFVKVAELGSFSRAADALFLTQPTVSEHVRALEDALGMQLLDRLGRTTTPTRAGALLLGYAGRLLTLAREASQAIEQFQRRMSGELGIGGSTIPGEYVLPELIGAFRGKYPDVRVSLMIGSSREPMILRERGSGSRETFEHALQGVGLDLGMFRIAGEIASTQAVKQAVRAGVGVSLISRRAVVDECRARLLVCVKIRDLTVSRAFHQITYRDRTRSPLAQAFLTFVESHLAARPS
jgi:DNA-binding transcriptional LysR family regulator